MSEVNSKTIKNYNDEYMIFYDLYDILPNMNMYILSIKEELLNSCSNIDIGKVYP